jgi:Xaa-Pro aminopeptidase
MGVTRRGFLTNNLLAAGVLASDMHSGVRRAWATQLPSTRGPESPPSFYLPMVFSREEYAQRLALFYTAMEKDGLDAMLLYTQHSMCYLFDYDIDANTRVYQTILLPANGGGPRALVRYNDLAHVRCHGFFEDIRTWGINLEADPISATVQLLRDSNSLKGKRIGIELAATAFNMDREGINVNRYLALNAAVQAGGGQLMDSSHISSGLRVRKSDAEITQIRRAAELTDVMFSTMFHTTRPGLRECDVAGAIMNETLRAGADYPIVPPLLSSGQNTLLRTHVPPTRKLIREGEIVMMETGAGYNNYYVCMGHSVICGRKPTKQMRDQYALARDEADMLRQLIRPGASVAEIARKLIASRVASRSSIYAPNEYGVQQFGGYSTGLGFGTVWYDALFISEQSEWVLEPNMVLSVFGRCQSGNRYYMLCADPILVTEQGFEDLSKLERNELRVAG